MERGGRVRAERRKPDVEPAATALEVPFAEEDAVVVEGTLEKEECGEGLPGELSAGGEENARPVQAEGTRCDQLVGGRAAMEAKVPGEPAVDAGHAAGEIELAVEIAGGAEGEGRRQLAVGSRQLAVEEPGKILPRDAVGQLEEDALHKQAVVRAG